MNPIYLLIEDFFCHTRSEIDFTGFTSACIVGAAQNNDQRSNGIGKSKIFTAITYCLFNKTELKNIENCVRIGAERCRVTFIFEAGGQRWKIVRSRGRKGQPEVMLFEDQAGQWVSQDERTGAQMEKEIFKILKMNYETFRNSVLFSQGDINGIATATPGARKALLRETLQLQNYKKLEDLTKKKIVNITKEAERNTTILSTLSTAEEDFKNYTDELSRIKPILKNLSKTTSIKKIEVSNIDKLINELNTNILNSKASFETVEKNFKNIQIKNKDLSSKKETISNKLKNIKLTTEQHIAALTPLKEELATLEAVKLPELNDLKKQTIDKNKELIDISNKISVIQHEITNLSTPLPNGPVCKHCKQNVSEDYRQSCKHDAEKEISSLLFKKEELNASAAQINKELKNININQEKAELVLKNIFKTKSSIESILKDIDVSKTFFNDYKQQLLLIKAELETSNAALDQAGKELAAVDKSQFQALTVELEAQNGKAKELRQELFTVEQQHIQAVSRSAQAEDRLNQAKKKIEQSIELKELIKNSQRQLNIHNQVQQAFSSKGIPTLIIHNMLDDLQENANNFISLIKPGIQLKFEIDKENSKGEQSDTLEISYFRDGIEHEWDQLSGGQKLVVMLSLRLAMSSVIQKNYGIDLKFILLDEIDASLDKESLELLFDMLKIIEQNFKILMITHNDSLKDKFQHAVWVEQDQNLNSTAKLVSSW